MAFTWVAVHKDGTLCHQFDPTTGAERSSEHIDRKQLATMVLYGHDNQPILTQHFESGHRLIYRRRVEQEPGGIPIVCHLLGWQKTVGTENVQHIAYVFEADGRIVVGGNWRNEHRWFYAPQLVPAEGIEVE